MVWEDWQGNERRVTFGELQELSNRFANVLEALGVEREDRVATLLPVAAGDRRGLPRHLQARRDPAVDVGALRRRGHPAPPARLGRAARGHRQREPRPDPGGARRARARDGRRLRARDGRRLARLRDRRHRRRRPGAALLLLGHHRPRQGHPPRAPLPARARGVRVLPRRARRRALPRLGRVGVGGGHLPAPRARGATARWRSCRRARAATTRRSTCASSRSTAWRTCSRRPRRSAR